MGTRILRGPVVKDRAGDRLRGAGDTEELSEGVTRLSDPRVRATACARPPPVAWPLAHRGRVTCLDGWEKVYRDGLLRGGGRRRHPWGNAFSICRRSAVGAVGGRGGGRRRQGPVGRGGRESAQDISSVY